MYSCQIKKNNIVVRDFVPCYRIIDNEIGLFDKIHNIFYANAGTDTFSKGNNVYRTAALLYKLETAKVPITDIQLNGTSIVNNAVANIDLTADDISAENTTNKFVTESEKTV